jgi:hypothetical protein
MSEAKSGGGPLLPFEAGYLLKYETFSRWRWCDQCHCGAGRQSPAKPLDLAFARRIHRCLNFEIEASSADPGSAAVSLF